MADIPITDEQVQAALMAYVQAGKRGEGLEGAMRAALAAAQPAVQAVQAEPGQVLADDEIIDLFREARSATTLSPFHEAARITEAAVLRRLAQQVVMWPKCPGVPDPACNYLAACNSICNKCGKVHTGHSVQGFGVIAAPVQQDKEGA